MIKSPLKHAGHNKFEIGWRELVGLPDLGISALRAKIDTGARTSALHAVDLSFYERNGTPWVDFDVPLAGESNRRRCAAPIVDDRKIKNTSGVSNSRFVVETTLVLAQRHWRIEVSLADREQMEFDLILGRTAIRGRRLLVDPGSSFLAGSPGEQLTTTLKDARQGLLRTLERGNSPADDALLNGDRE